MRAFLNECASIGLEIKHNKNGSVWPQQQLIRYVGTQQSTAEAILRISLGTPSMQAGAAVRALQGVGLGHDAKEARIL